MQLIDIGANLTHTSFAGDLAQVLQRAQAAGVAQLIVTGASAEGSVAAMQLAQAHPERLYATAGVHPHHASDYDAFTESLLGDLLQNQAVRASGECGLDYNRNFSPREAQLFAFERQLALSVQHGKPAFLHQRDAHEDFLSVLKNFRSALPAVVVHCFTGVAAELHDYLDLDCHIGITGWICDERRGQHLLPLMPSIPADRLMIETDAPYLLPRTLKPAPKDRRNEPAFLPLVLRCVAQARGESVASLAGSTSATARKFFAIPELAA